MIERIQELSPGQIDRLKKLGKDALSAISPPIASMIYSNTPDQLQALRNIGPDTLGAMSPQLADILYGNDPNYGGSAVGTYGDDGYGGSAVGPYGDQRQPPIILPPQPDYVIWWANADACETCLENVADEPRPYGTPFSSGDVGPPAHEHCRCELVNSMRGSFGHCPVHGRRVFELSSRF